MNVAYNQDCLEAMREMTDNAFDLAIVDPPYGIGEGGQKASSRGKQADFGKSKANALAYNRTYHTFDDSEAPGKEYFDQLRRVSKNQIVFGANHFIENMPYSSHCWLVWDKQNDANDFADCELAWTSFKTAVRIFRFKWNGMLQKEAPVEPEKPATEGKNESVYFCRLLEEIQRQNELLEQLIDVVIPKYVSDVKDNLNANFDAQTAEIKKGLDAVAANTRKRGL